MDDRLKQILSLAGVEGCLVIMGTGEMVAQAGLEPYRPLLPEMVRRLLRVISAFAKNDSRLGELEFIWENRRLIAAADKDLMLLAVCSSGTSFPLVRMRLNVTLATFRDDKKIQKKIKKNQGLKIDHLRIGDLDQTEINLISKLQ